MIRHVIWNHIQLLQPILDEHERAGWELQRIAKIDFGESVLVFRRETEGPAIETRGMRHG